MPLRCTLLIPFNARSRPRQMRPEREKRPTSSGTWQRIYAPRNAEHSAIGSGPSAILFAPHRANLRARSPNRRRMPTEKSSAIGCSAAAPAASPSRSLIQVKEARTPSQPVLREAAPRKTASHRNREQKTTCSSLFLLLRLARHASAPALPSRRAEYGRRGEISVRRSCKRRVPAAKRLDPLIRPARIGNTMSSSVVTW